ncbi:MAG: hypothetical protein H0X51_03305 [Parachlamydiaceae bacterium]|nr:hypothetical protein [Parachlamydiaceae bacterium]
MLKYLLLSLTLFFTCTVHATDTRSIFVTEDLQPQPLLIELLQLDNLYNPNDTFQDIVQKTQKCWLSVQQGLNQRERTDLVDNQQRQLMQERVLEIAAEIGLLNAIPPQLTHYESGICLGAFLSDVRARLTLLVDAWKQGIRFDSLYFLTGERYLRKGPGQQDDFEALCNPALSPLPFKATWIRPDPNSVAYETEYDMMRLVWEQVEIPTDMAKTLKDRVFFVNAPKGNFPRPSTADTYVQWLLDYQCTPGTVVAASTPLVWSQQQLVGERVLGPQFHLETIASAPTDAEFNTYFKNSTSIVLDTVAKCLFEISLIKN